MAPISLLYHAGDAEKWTKYFHKLLSQYGDDSEVGLLDLRENSSRLQKTADTSTVVALMISPCMLEPEMENVFIDLQGHKNRNIVLLNCFLEEEEEKEILDRFTFLKSLSLLNVSEDAQENIDIVSELLGTVDKLERDERKRLSQFRKHHSKFRIIPHAVYEQSTLVYLNFEREMQGTVTVSYGKRDEIRMKTEAYNPFSVMFTAEDLLEGNNRVCVFVDDCQVGECKLLFKSPLLTAFESPMYLCQSLGLGLNDMEALDKRLVNIFKQSAPDDQSHISLMGTPIYDNTQESQATAEVPSLLHFAAKNGLSELCSLLLNIPGGSEVYRIKNSRGKNVYKLAIESGHHDLANYTKLFLETEAMVLACDSIYLNKRHFQKNKASDSPFSSKHSSTADTPGLLAPSDDGTKRWRNPSTKDPSPLTRIYSVKKEYHPESRSRSCPRSIDNRPPQPVPRCPSPSPHRQARPVHVYDEIDLPGQESSKPVVKERPLSAAEIEKNTNQKREFKSGSKAMDELIQITKQTVDREFTMEEAERLYDSWKQRNQNPSLSIRQNQQNLQELRNQYLTLIEQSEEDHKSAIDAMVGKFKRVFSTKKIKKRELQISGPFSQHLTVESASSGSSGSGSSGSGSSGSRGSQISTGSGDNMLGDGIEGSDELTGDESPDIPFTKMSEYYTNVDMSSSKRENFLRSVSYSNELDLAPPDLPPRKYLPQAAGKSKKGPVFF